MQFYDLIVIGGGVSGISAALEAKKNGIENILILEKEFELGGMLNQCIDSGFGLELFNENLTGPEYAQRLIDLAIEMDISYKVDTTVIELKKDKTVIAVNSSEGLLELMGKSIIISVGCVERARNAINILGNKFAGVYTISAAQRLVNMEGFLPGKEVIIIGTGSLALNIARRMTIEGAKVKAVIEKSDVLTEKRTDMVKCMADFDIPILFNHQVVDINGQERVEGITLVQIDSNGKPVSGSEKTLACDAILLSVTLEPNNKLIKKAEIARIQGKIYTDIEGVLLCGNADYIHQDTESLLNDCKLAGDAASKYILSEKIQN